MLGEVPPDFLLGTDNMVQAADQLPEMVGLKSFSKPGSPCLTMLDQNSDVAAAWAMRLMRLVMPWVYRKCWHCAPIQPLRPQQA